MANRITATELAQMYATLDDLKMRGWPGTGLSLGDQRRLLREIEELRKNLDVELDLNTHLVGRIDQLRTALRAALLFHSGGEWDDAKRQQWQELTGSTEATTKVLCNTVRAALGDEG